METRSLGALGSSQELFALGARQAGALAPEPTRVTGVGPEFDLYILFFLQCSTLSVLVSNVVTFFTFFFEILQGFNFFS